MTVDFAVAPGLAALFVLYLARTGGMMLLVPVLGGANIPLRVRVALVVIVSTVLFLARPAGSPTDLDFSLFLAVLTARELLLGLLIGTLVRAMLLPFVLAGEIVSHEMAFSMSSVVSPDSGRGSGLITVLFEMFALVIFVTFDFHHDVLRLLAVSIDATPPANGAGFPQWLGWVLAYLSFLLRTGAVLVAPLFVFLLVITLAVGMLSKTVPQMNVLDFSFPTRILAAMAAMLLFVPEMAARVHQIFQRETGALFRFLGTW